MKRFVFSTAFAAAFVTSTAGAQKAPPAKAASLDRTKQPVVGPSPTLPRTPAPLLQLLHLLQLAGKEEQMTRVLFVGQRPETVDFTNPAIPPGMNAEKIHAGIEVALKQMAERGWIADLCLLQPDETAGPDVERALRTHIYDCVVIGAGIRLPPKSLPFFEAIINAVHKGAPTASIAFNTGPETTAESAARWLKDD